MMVECRGVQVNASPLVSGNKKALFLLPRPPKVVIKEKWGFFVSSFAEAPLSCARVHFQFSRCLGVAPVNLGAFFPLRTVRFRAVSFPVGAVSFGSPGLEVAAEAPPSSPS